MRVENIDATVDACVSGGAGEKRLVDESTAGMESYSGDLNACGNLRKLGICGDCGEGKIGAANFGCGVGLEGEHGSVGGGAEVGRGVVRGESGKLIRSGCVPKGERAAGCVGESDEDLIAIAVRLHERSAGDAGDFRFCGLLKGWRAGGQI